MTYSDSFDLQCIIKPHYRARVPVSVTWRFQPVGTIEFHDLVTFTRDGGVQWGDRSSSFRTRTAIEKVESSNNVRLSISRASDTEAGKYQCVAELWRQNYNSSWTRLAERTSNLLEIRVLQPGRGSAVLVLGAGCWVRRMGGNRTWAFGPPCGRVELPAFDVEELQIRGELKEWIPLSRPVVQVSPYSSSPSGGSFVVAQHEGKLVPSGCFLLNTSV